MRRLIFSLLLGLAASSVVAAPAPFAKPERRSDSNGDLARLQGTWTLDAAFLFRDDVWVKTIVPVANPLVIRGDVIAWQGNFAPSALVETVTLHKGPYPRGIDFISPREGGLERAVYTIEGDTVTIVLPLSRAERATLERGSFKLVYFRKR